MLEIAVCDDTPEENLAVSQYTADFFSKKEINTQIDRFYSAEELLKTKKLYDLYLLDVLMPGMTGIEIAEILKKTDKHPVIIFITSSLESAVEGYRVNASGFILKPVDESHFSETMERVVEQKLGLKREYISVIHDRIPMKIALNRIQYMENKLRRVSIVMSDGEVITVGQKLSQLQELLPEHDAFLRCHQSYIVNMDYIEKIEDFCFYLKDGKIIPISRNYQKDCKNRYYHYRLK